MRFFRTHHGGLSRATDGEGGSLLFLFTCTLFFCRGRLIAFIRFRGVGPLIGTGAAERRRYIQAETVAPFGMRPAEAYVGAIARTAHAAGAELTKLCLLPVHRCPKHLCRGRLPGLILLEVLFTRIFRRMITVIRRRRLIEDMDPRQRGREATRLHQVLAKASP